MTTESTVTREKLSQDIKTVIADAEELLRATANEAGGKVSAMREKIQDSLQRAKVRLAAAEDAVAVKGKEAATMTDEYVRSHPWHAVGAAAGVGLIIGLLIGRR